MSNYHYEMLPISRKAGASVTQRVSYISGRTLHDTFNGRTYSCTRNDIAYCEIFLPENAPQQLYDPQKLVTALDEAEIRKDSRTGRETIAALPNELSMEENVKIVKNFAEEYILSDGLCVIAAIHKGENAEDPSKANPHVHFIASTRAVGANGFCRKKLRFCDECLYLIRCREAWAREINAAYERNGYDIRVDHRSLRDQGIQREPVNHLSRYDIEREKHGERTLAGDRRREIEARNAELERQRMHEREYNRAR